MSDFLQIHTAACAGWRDPAGDFAGCSCHVDHAAELQAECDQLRAQLADANRFADEQRIRAESLTVRLESAERERIELRGANKELRHAQDLFLQHLSQPSRFRLYIQPRLTPDSDGDLDVILPDGAVVGYVSQRVLGGYLATFIDASWAVPFPSQADAVDWLTELAQYSAWADLQQEAAAAAEED